MAGSSMPTARPMASSPSPAARPRKWSCPSSGSRPRRSNTGFGSDAGAGRRKEEGCAHIRADRQGQRPPPKTPGAASAAPPRGKEPLACAFTLSPSSHRACHIRDACLLICQPDVDILNFMRAGFCMPIFLLNEKVVALEFITRKEFEQPDPQAVQDAVIEADPERFLRAGLADDRCHGGRYVSADLFKEVFAQFGASKDSRNRYDTPVHNPAAVLSSEQFRRAVADGSEPKRDQVVFLTGVP